jgi:hypothetical protein
MGTKSFSEGINAILNISKDRENIINKEYPTRCNNISKFYFIFM